MGRNKALVEIEGRPLIERTVDLARMLTDQIFISSNDTACYEYLNLPVVPDIFVGQGPLAGLHSVMLRTDRALILLLASDLPKIHRDLLLRLIESSPGFDAVIPRTSDGRVQPLCGIYRRSYLQPLEHNLRQGINKVSDLLRVSSLRVKVLDGEEGQFRDSDLVNLNYPDQTMAASLRK